MRYFLSLLVLGLLWPEPGRATELTGTLQKIDESGVIAIGHREASYPFSFRDEAGNTVGYSIDLCLEVVAETKAALGRDDIEVRFVPVTPKTRMDLVQDGTIDIECGSTTIALDRLEKVDFSLITFITGAKLLVRKDSGIADFGDLAGKTVAVARGTTTEAGVRRVLLRTGLDVTVLQVTDHDEGFRALADGQADAYISDHILLYGLKDKADDSSVYKVVGDYLSYEPYGLMMRRNDSAFRLVVNRALVDLFRSDEISRIYLKWFGPMGMSPGDLLRAAVTLQSFPD